MQSYEIISKIGKVLTLFVCNLTLYVADFAFFFDLSQVVFCLFLPSFLWDDRAFSMGKIDFPSSFSPLFTRWQTS